MTREVFNEWLKTQPVEDKIVHLRYKYSYEKDWTYDNQILGVDLDIDGYYVWCSDWYEGQEEVEILGCVAVSDIIIPNFEHKEIEG